MRKRITIALIFCFAVIVLYTICARQVTLVYHRWRFNIANDYMTNGTLEVLFNGMLAIDLTTVAPRHEYHMSRLVELGAIAKIEFPMSNIANNSPMRSSFLKKILAGDCPRSLYWSSPYYVDANPTVLEVWCELADREAWTKFLQRENELAGQESEQRVADEALDNPF